MKVHTNNFKSKIKDFGRELDSKIIYTINGVTTELGSPQLNSVTPHYEANLLKSVMKQLDIDSNVDIPIGTEINYQFGLKVGNSYEYLDYGNYIVYSSEKQEDSKSWKLIAYDKMLNAMKDYENLNITYPITVRNYIIAICNKIGLTFKNASEEFANYDKNILEELYLDADGNSLGYTYRDVLDELAQVTASVICIDKNDNLEIRYINELVNEEITETGNRISIENARSRELEDFTLLGNATQNSTTGANILPQNKYIATTTTNGITFTNNGDGTFNLVGTASANTTIIIIPIGNISLEANQPYYLYSSVPYNGTTFNMSIPMTDNGTTKFLLANGTYTPTATPTNVRLQFYIASGKSVNKTNIKLMLVKGSTAPSQYEPYTGGIPSPNPGFPEDIHVVSGDNSINMCGKNLLRYDLAHLKSKNTTGTWNNNVYTSNGLTITINDDLSIKINGTSTAQETFFINQETIYLPTGTYYLSGSINGSNTTYDIRTYNYNGGGSSSQCFTGAKETAFVNNNQNFNVAIVVRNGQTLNNVLFYPMLSTTNDTTYEPYKGHNYEINLGKNLFQTIQTATSKGVTLTNNDDGSYTLNGTTTGVAIFNQTLTTQLPPGTYTVSYESSVPLASDFFVRIRNQDGAMLVPDAIPSQVRGNNTTTNKVTFTSTDYGAIVAINLVTTGITYNNVNVKIQLEKGTTATSYSPYKTPIELCKIGSNQDKIFKGKGVNLFDYSYSNLANTTRATVSEENNGFKVTSTGVIGFGYSSLQLDNSLLGKQITISMNSSGDKTPSGRLFYVKDNGTLGTNVGAFWTTNNSHTETLPSTLPDGTKAIALVLYISQSTNSSGNYAIFRNIQVQLGNTATEYEPFNSKDKWLLRKEIGKDIYDGSENWSGGNVATNVYRFYRRVDDLYAYTDSSRHIDRHIANRFTLSTSNVVGATYQYQTNLYFCVSGNEATTYNEFKTWLASNNLVVYYILSVPIITQLTDTELINQLDSLKLMYGRNEIFLNSNGTLSFKYISEYETIDENYLKDINVNFGENFGPINSIVLTRAGGSDSVYINDEPSINNYGLHEIKIEDNQIMNLNNRADFLPDLLKYLDGIEYFYNDFSSTGICYLDLLDLYTVKIDNNYYNCLMLNDEADITQGLEEQIHTDIAEETETDYQYASKDDRQRTMAYIIAKKNEGEIEALASKVVDLSNTINGIGSITLENAYEGTLHRLEISGSILLIYPSNTLYPSETLTILDTDLLVDTNKYHLDIDRLNYTSATEHDTYIYEDGKNWIERANGTIEQKEDFTIEVTENSAISLEQFPNAIFKCIYLLQNDYTNTFTNSLDIVSKINLSPEKIEINSNKISLAGKTIDLTSELININSKYFKVDSEGNLTATSATLNGRFENYSKNGKLAISINNTIMKFYDYKGTEAQVGGICSTRGNQDNVTGISLFTIQGSKLILGYKEQEDNSTIKSIIYYDTNDLTRTPWIKNTVSGTLFSNCKNGITIDHGLIKNWDLYTSSGNIIINEPNGHQVKIIVEDGLISTWQYT